MWQKNPSLGLWAYHTAVLSELWQLEDVYSGDFKLYVDIDNECYFYNESNGKNPWEYYFLQPTKCENWENYTILEKHPFEYKSLGFIGGTMDYDENIYIRLKQSTQFLLIK